MGIEICITQNKSIKNKKTFRYGIQEKRCIASIIKARLLIIKSLRLVAHQSCMISIIFRIKYIIQILIIMTQPNIIESFDFIMVFEGDNQLSSKIENAKEDLMQACISWQLFKNGKKLYLLLGFQDQDKLFTNAEKLQILKKREKSSFQMTDKQIDQHLEQFKHYKIYCQYLKYVKVRKNYPEIMQQQNLSAYKQQNSSKFLDKKKDRKNFFTLDEKCRCKYNELLNFQIVKQGQCEEFFFQELIHSNQFQQIIPIHKTSQYKINGFVEYYTQSIKQYLGSNIQVYFQFVRYMSKWLIPPAILGFLTIILNYYYGYTADDSPLDSIYAFAITTWSIFFVTSWQKKQKWLNVINSNGYNSTWAFHQKMVIHQKNATKKTSDITGQQQIYHSGFNLIKNYLRTIGVLFFPISISILFLVFSLNMRGFIDKQHKILYWQQITNWSQPNGIFDKTTNYSLIPVLIHAIVTNGIDQMIYRRLAIWTTKKQQHLDSDSYQNSIIVKYFIFEMLITFVDLFYIAFIRFDIMGLKEQMSTLFIADIARRLFAQTLLPLFFKFINSYNYEKKVKSNVMTNRQILQQELFLEIGKRDYEPFDDYLEIVTNFGYLVMLSSCFPMAPILILLSHLIQVMHDKYKVLFLYKKILPRKFQGIGFWKDLMILMCYLSIITNIVLFAFSSHQIVGFFPKLFDGGKNVILGNTHFTTFMTEAVYNLTDIISSSQQDTNQLNPNLFKNDTHCQASPFSLFEATKPQMLMSFVPPIKEQESHFVIVIFVIEHIFIIIVIGIRKNLKRRTDLADIFLERRQYKRIIKSKMKTKFMQKIRKRQSQKKQNKTSTDSSYTKSQQQMKAIQQYNKKLRQSKMF